MKRYSIVHQTTYRFSGSVQLLPHTLRLRPREGHELRIESSTLDIDPPATLRWQRDVEGNCVATATFTQMAQVLAITSEVVIQQYDQAPYDFLVADYAVDYPFSYSPEDCVLLSPYLSQYSRGSAVLAEWMQFLMLPNEKLQTFSLLLRLNQRIFGMLNYRRRDEEGVQSPEQTLRLGTGSCRDYAGLFIEAARQLGFACRFVSGYLYSEATSYLAGLSGSTHAWAEVFIPGAGWKGFDPTLGSIAGSEHIAVAVARLPVAVPPVAGAFLGVPGATLSVAVWVTELPKVPEVTC